MGWDLLWLMGSFCFFILNVFVGFCLGVVSYGGEIGGLGLYIGVMCLVCF